MDDIDTIIEEWFGVLDEEGRVAGEKTTRWWKKDPNFDEMLRKQYGKLIAQALRGELDAWAETPRGTLALILLLDQFTRNTFRDTPEMYSGDDAAIRHSLSLVESERVAELPYAQRVFVYMPLMHSEDLKDQELCVKCFESLVDTSPRALQAGMQSNLKYAIAHRDIVARWGRFPHRNEILGRESTPEELEFLKQPGSSF